MGYVIEYATGGKAAAYTYKTIDGAEKKAIELYRQSGKPTVVVDERYRRGKRK